MASEIILTVSERRNRQKLTLSSTAAPFVFGRGRDCSFVLRRNNVGEHQFTIEYKNNAWLMQDAGSTTCGTWYNNRYIHSGEEVTLQPGDVIGLNTDGNETTQEITFRVEEIRQGEGTAALRRETPNATVLPGAGCAPQAPHPDRPRRGLRCAADQRPCFPPPLRGGV